MPLRSSYSPEELRHLVFNLPPDGFEAIALAVFRYQASANALYAQYIRLLGIDTTRVNRIEQIPFLPISFFKTHQVQCGSFEPQLYFESSSTTGQVPSRHAVADPLLYETSFLKTFEQFYGDPGRYCILALLPSYLERGNSSLVYMVNGLMQQGGHPQSKFFGNDLAGLAQALSKLEKEGQPVWLIGVAFALLDLAEQHPMQLAHTTLVETGGMKGRQVELVREDLHHRLKEAFGVQSVHAEYGMTELFSQAYATGQGVFRTPPWMHVMVREQDDPFAWCRTGKAGAINVIDLANLDTCAFIATDDVGRLLPDGGFEVLGRMDASEVRGCSLMYTG
ncbi:MAG: acyl transferase [Flavobacteriales bacterium]|nr:acyl transferase [Flavobacteriales bacterium]